MKVIQNQNGIELLKATNTVPSELIQVIEQDFQLLFEAEGIEEDILKFHLPYQQSLIILEANDHVLDILDANAFDIEYVERHKQGSIEFYRIAKRFDHEFQMIYSLVSIHEEETEQFLRDHSVWNEGLGDFRV